MAEKNPISDLLRYMANLYGHEDSADGRAAVTALLQAAETCKDFPPHPCPKPDLLSAALRINPHAGIDVFEAAIPYLAWFEPSNAIKNLTEQKAQRMTAVELLGPDGMIKN